MSFLLDSAIAIHYLQSHPVVVRHVQQHGNGLHLSVISLAEMEQWAVSWNTPIWFQQSYLQFLQSVTIHNVDEPIAQRGGSLGAGLSILKVRMSTADLLVSAAALVNRLTLVTHATKRFARIQGLAVVDWMVP